MELRESLSLSSSWEASHPLKCALYVKSSSGALLEEPYASEREKTLVLRQPDPGVAGGGGGGEEGRGRGCEIYLDAGNMRGYSVSSLEVCSSARVVEVYEGGDCYLGTAKGSFVRTLEDGVKIYSCCFQLPQEDGQLLGAIKMKLLSLRGRSEVCVERLEAVVGEDHGGVSLGEEASVTPHDPQLLMDMTGLPPFMQGLVSALQRMPTQQGPPGTSLGQPGSIPEEFSNLAAVLKEMRPPPATDSQAELTNHITEDSDDITAKAGGGSESVEEGLEERLRGYIDAQFECLWDRVERQIEEKFNELKRTLCAQGQKEQEN